LIAWFFRGEGHILRLMPTLTDLMPTPHHHDVPAPSSTPQDKRTLAVGDHPPDVAAVVRVSRHGAAVTLTAAARQRMAAERAVVERIAKQGQPVYGLTTGLGASVDTALPPDDVVAFQTRAVLGRSVAVGPALPRETVRAAMFVRIAKMAAGGSGVSPHVADGLVALINAGVHPRVPSIGSIGAADLVLCAHLALPLIGLGEAELRGELMTASRALARVGLSPLELGAKDGLALINCNAFSVGAGALAVADAAAALDALDISAALAIEAFRASLSPLDARVQKSRPAPGQERAAARLRTLLHDSTLLRPDGPRRVQDPLCFRSVAPVHGAVLWAIDQSVQAVEIELASGGDNPLVLPDGDVLSTGNFDVTALTLEFERLCQALTHAAGLCVHRSLKLMSPRFSELPCFLSPLGPTRSGFAAMQKTIAALEAEIRHLALPASLAVHAVADGVEDHASMTLQVAEKAGQIVARVRLLAAVELMVAAQALDLRPAPLGASLRSAYEAVRGVVAILDEDRVTGPDIERIASLIEDGSLLRAVLP
jgi:histidine ammonia-lyase